MPVVLRAYVVRSGAILVGVALALFGVFLPTLIVPYGFSDDYVMIAMGNGFGPSDLGKSILDDYGVSGRPFAGLLADGFFSVAGTIDNLRFARLIAVVGVVALAVLMHFALVRSGLGLLAAAAIATLACTMPGFQVLVSWTVCFPYPYAAVLGGAASVVAAGAAGLPRNLALDRLLGSAGLLVMALLLYQPAAMVFWVFFAIALVGAAADPRRPVDLAKAHLAVATASLAVAFVVLKLGAHIVGQAPTSSRNALTHDPVGKARWFVEQPLYRALNLFDLTPSRGFAALVAVTAASGIALLLRTRCARPLLYAGIAVALIPLSFLPSLLAHENLLTYRIQVALSSLIVLYFSLGVIGIWLAAKAWLRPRVGVRALSVATGVVVAAAAAFVGAGAFLGSKNVTTLFVDPQMTELRLIRTQVAALPTGVERVGFVGTPFDLSMAKFVLNDEFGLPSTSQPFTLAPLVFDILKEEGRLPGNAKRPVVDFLSWDALPSPSSEPVIDVRGIAKFR